MLYSDGTKDWKGIEIIVLHELLDGRKYNWMISAKTCLKAVNKYSYILLRPVKENLIYLLLVPLLIELGKKSGYISEGGEGNF